MELPCRCIDLSGLYFSLCLLLHPSVYVTLKGCCLPITASGISICPYWFGFPLKLIDTQNVTVIRGTTALQTCFPEEALIHTLCLACICNSSNHSCNFLVLSVIVGLLSKSVSSLKVCCSFWVDYCWQYCRGWLTGEQLRPVSVTWAVMSFVYLLFRSVLSKLSDLQFFLELPEKHIIYTVILEKYVIYFMIVSRSE